MRCHFNRTALGVALALSTGAALAAADTDGATVVVVATRQPSRVSALAADVSVLERQDIEAVGPAATLGDLLSTLPGIELSRQGSRGASEGIFMRGANTGHTLVLVDGLRVGSATLGQTAIEGLPLAQVERIEILRGPASALYGSEAIGGVIRITTRPTAATPLLDVRAGAGSHGTHEASVAHAAQRGALSYAIRAGELRAGGVNAITNPASPAYNTDKDGYWRRHLALDATWRPDSVTEIGAHWLESTGANQFDASWPTAMADWRTRQAVTAFSTQARRRLSDVWTSELRIGRSEDLSVTTPSTDSGVPHDRFGTRQDQFAWQNDLSLPLGRGLIALETLREEISSTNIYTGTRRGTDSLVLGWNGNIGAHAWQLGLRHDDSSQYGGKTTHSANYGYRLAPDWRVSASVGTAFKAPTFNDLYFPNTPFVGSGNPHLVPESAKSRELALNYADQGREATLTAFRNDIHQLIQWEESAPGSFFYTPTNIGAARITGLSTAGKLHLGAWTLGAHATFQSPRNRDSGEYLTRRATRFGKLSLDRGAGPWLYGIELAGAGRRYDAPDFVTGRNTRSMGGYGIVNLRGEYRVDHQWSLFARIDNLFDKHYALASSAANQYAALGATAFVGARFVMR